MNYYCEHNICPMVTTLPVKTDTVMVSKDLHLQQVANVLGINIEQLRAINPQYRKDIVNGYAEPLPLRLPQEYVNAFIDSEDSIYVNNRDLLLTKRETVEVPEVKAQTYTRSSKAKSSKRSKKARKSRRGKNVTVRQGDTLSEIAARNHTTVAKLKKLNKISGTNIRAGKKIRVK